MTSNLVLFDANTLSNFAAVDYLDLPATAFAGRAGWTVVVAAELRRGADHEEYLRGINTGWLGAPREPPDGPAHLASVQQIRRAITGSPRQPLSSLGEAETIHYIETCAPGSTFVTDDRVALDFARRRGIAVGDTSWVLQRIYIDGRLECPEPYDLLCAMRDSGRHVRVPHDHAQVCPADARGRRAG